MSNYIFDITNYMKWIKFREPDIHNILENSNDDVIEYCNGIWNECILVNTGVNSRYINEANYLLFSHLFIINSEYFNPAIYDKYDIGNQMANIGQIISSVSDSSTSVNSHITKAAQNLSLSQQGYMLTKFGYKYICLISSLNMIRVI